MDKVEPFIDASGDFRFRVRNVENGQVRSGSSEGYESEAACIICLVDTRDAINAFIAERCNMSLGEAGRMLNSCDSIERLKAANIFERVTAEPKSLAQDEKDNA